MVRVLMLLLGMLLAGCASPRPPLSDLRPDAGEVVGLMLLLVLVVALVSALLPGRAAGRPRSARVRVLFPVLLASIAACGALLGVNVVRGHLTSLETRVLQSVLGLACGSWLLLRSLHVLALHPGSVVARLGATCAGLAAPAWLLACWWETDSSWPLALAVTFLTLAVGGVHAGLLGPTGSPPRLGWLRAVVFVALGLWGPLLMLAMWVPVHGHPVLAPALPLGLVVWLTSLLLLTVCRRLESGPGTRLDPPAGTYLHGCEEGGSALLLKHPHGDAVRCEACGAPVIAASHPEGGSATAHQGDRGE